MASYQNSTRLFELPVASANGKITCFNPADRVYIVEFNSPPDNRLTTVCH